MKFYLLYLDPGSGSYLLQAIIAGVLGGLMFFKNFWITIKSFFIKQKPTDVLKEKEPEEEERN